MEETKTTTRQLHLSHCFCNGSSPVIGCLGLSEMLVIDMINDNLATGELFSKQMPAGNTFVQLAR